MDPQLFRIDDRLIHGQVVLGWAKPLNSKCILLCDDEIASCSWEKELYLTCVTDNIKTLVYNIKETSEYIFNQNGDLKNTIILVKSPKVVLKLMDFGFKPNTINIGGLHFSDSRKEYLPYVYINDSEINDFSNLIKQNISIYCQDVPTGKKYMLEDILP